MSQLYFGQCDRCAEAGEVPDTEYPYLNIGRSHWFFCERHRTRWCAGFNLFSTWQDQTEDEQRAKYEEIDFGAYREFRTRPPVPEGFALVGVDPGGYVRLADSSDVMKLGDATIYGASRIAEKAPYLLDIFGQLASMTDEEIESMSNDRTEERTKDDPDRGSDDPR
jgi:hypothetical protein